MNKPFPNNVSHCFFDSVVHYDMQRDEKRLHYFGENAQVVEPIFVPRSNQAKEGDGFVLCYVYRKSLNRSDLVILDSNRIEDEPGNDSITTSSSIWFSWMLGRWKINAIRFPRTFLSGAAPPNAFIGGPVFCQRI